ncbi:ribosome biogenesis GTP-binding protein YihA/YsxC [bacterium]|nr:ribosome biogenesis GTP-binding protein YihA/YsxC [bacterium]
MKIVSATFVTSAVDPRGYPPADLPEIAFAGRSNVGKSSLLNALVNRKGLAKTSQTPGKTRLLNFFDVNGRVRFVDLPGFGYAKVPRPMRESWRPMVEGYLKGDRDLRAVVLLVDARRGPRAEEVELLEWLDEIGIPAIVALTKIDKLNRAERTRLVRTLRETWDVSAEDYVLTSASKREGLNELWRRIRAAIDVGHLDRGRAHA